MSLIIHQASNINDVAIWIKGLKQTGIVAATKSSMIRTRPTMKKSSIEMVKKFRKAKSTTISDRFRFSNRLGGSTISKLEIEMKVSPKRINLLEFVKGKKQRQRKRGVPVRKRRKLKVEVFPGRVRRLKTSFIEKGRSGNLMVLQRIGRKAKPVRRATGVFIHSLFAKEAVTKPIQSKVANKWIKEWLAAINKKMRKNPPKRRVKKV